MKSILILLICAALINSCKRIEPSNNALLAEKVKIWHVVKLENKYNPSWVSGLDTEKLFSQTFNNVLSNKVNAYIPNGRFGDTINSMEKIEVERINRYMDWTDSTIKYEDLKEISFYETWVLDKNKFRFMKEVHGWIPIRTWFRNGDLLKRQVFYLYPDQKKKGDIVASNIIYEHALENMYPNIMVGFDKNMLTSYLVENINSGKINAYDPIYIVDQSKRKLTIQQIEEIIGEPFTPSILAKYFYSIIFLEDWYFDENTLSISKDVKAIALVRFKTDRFLSEQDFKKKILFFLFFN